MAQELEQVVMCRVILNDHLAEMTDLPVEGRQHLMAIVFATEGAIRDVVRPDKINLASLGNQVPHLHWHVIARFYDDPHFPDPIWATAKRKGVPRTADPSALAAALKQRIALEVES